MDSGPSFSCIILVALFAARLGDAATSLPKNFQMLEQQPHQERACPPPTTGGSDGVRSDDRDRHFETDFLKPDLAGRSMRGGALTVTAQGFKFLISTAATIVVARLLTPQDYGLVGMVVILISFLGMFQYMGLTAATVKWADLNHAQVSTLFWINVALSAVIMLAVLACAPLLAWFYHEPRLIGIAAGYAFVIFIRGFSIQHLAILQRQMRFLALTVIDIGAVAVGLAVTIFAAWRGAGYWSLVVNQWVFSLLAIAGAWTACRWRPGLPSRNSGVRSMLRFGGSLTGYSFTTFFAQNTDNALIGKFWGAYQLGIYSRAYQMLLTPIGLVIMPLSAVATPALSRLADSPDRYRAAYLNIVEKISMLTMPAVVFAIATSDWLILLLLGPQWREASSVFMLLGIAAIMQPVSRTGIWLLVTQGRSREMVKWGVVSGTLAVVSILGGLPWGATGVAASYAITDLCLTTPLLFWYIGRKGPVRFRDIYQTLTPAIFAAACSLIALLVCRPWLEMARHAGVRLTFAFAITLIVSLSVFAVMPAGRHALQNFTQMLKLLVKKGELAPQS